jgi:hypothetical protein
MIVKRDYVFRIIAFIALTIGFAACSSVQNKSEMTGVYELGSGNQKITLEIFPDDTFAETIQFTSGRVEKLHGKWDWQFSRIGFNPLWIPASFAPDYILQSDSKFGTKYTEPGPWSTSATKYWGTITLEIFDDVSFKLIRHIP